MLSHFQADIACPRGQYFDRRFLRSKSSVCSRPGIRAATPISLISGYRNSFPTSSARLAAARRIMRSGILIFQGNFVLDLA
jgi:hypothetical protein